MLSQIKETWKLRVTLACGEFTGDQGREKCFHLMTSSWQRIMYGLDWRTVQCAQQRVVNALVGALTVLHDSIYPRIISFLVQHYEKPSNDDRIWPELIHTVPHLFCLTYWGREKMDAISQTTSSSAFSWMKMFEFRLKFQWRLFRRVQLTIFQHWSR